MDEIISILKNAEKVDQLILKLKTLGEQSPQFQTFKTSVDSFHLNLPPKGVDQKNILQTVFKYSDPLECFQTFRLVCKPWKNAVETIRFNKLPPNDLMTQMSETEMNHQIRTFYSKYLKCFKKVNLFFGSDFDQTNWDLIANILVKNMKDLNEIQVWQCDEKHLQTKLMYLLFDLFKNSQRSLKHVSLYSFVDLTFLPSISLPNVSAIQVFMTRQNDSQAYTNSFKYFMQTFVDKMCPDLKQFKIKKIHRVPNILNYLIKDYPQHFVCAPQASILEHIPLKISHLKLQNLAAYRFLSQVEYLILRVPNFRNPSEGGWDNYQEILKFCPNLKGIILDNETKYFNFSNIYAKNIPSSAKNIWKQRYNYFKSKNIQLLTINQYKCILSEACNSVDASWYFNFL